MTFNLTRAKVFNRGIPPTAFLQELVEWGKTAPAEIFERNPHFDIYSKVKAELGPIDEPLRRRAIMLEVLRVLAGFESEWDWKEGVDTSRLGDTTPENAEAGAWQVSYDSRRLDQSLQLCLQRAAVHDGVTFQRKIKFDHAFAMEYEARLLRIDVKDFHRLHNGPLYKGEERIAIRRSLRGPEQSIYPWLSQLAVNEFMQLLAA